PPRLKIASLNGMGGTSAVARLALLFLLLDFKPSSSQRTDSYPLIANIANKKECPLPGETETCKCITRVRKEIEEYCCCIGASIRTVPQNMTGNLRSLLLYRTSITSIPLDAFSKYDLLEELEIHTMSITSFDYSSLRNMTHLRKFIIRNCTSLTEIEGTMMLSHRKIRKIDLRSNALRFLPTMEMSAAHTFNAEVDLTDNEIELIPTGKLRNLLVRLFKITHNRLQRIEADAFVNSSIHDLWLHDNPDLTHLAPNAFAQINVLN
ncbi:hypothetical protein PFISCL1PPCAC_344, partial [Pristionchus fissidentatus]